LTVSHCIRTDTHNSNQVKNGIENVIVFKQIAPFQPELVKYDF